MWNGKHTEYGSKGMVARFAVNVFPMAGTMVVSSSIWANRLWVIIST